MSIKEYLQIIGGSQIRKYLVDVIYSFSSPFRHFDNVTVFQGYTFLLK